MRTLHIPVASYPQVPVAGLVGTRTRTPSPTCRPEGTVCICCRSMASHTDVDLNATLAGGAQWPASVSQSTRLDEVTMAA